MPIYSVNMGDPFGLLNEIQTECEYQSLTIGSRLSDAFNSYDESVPFYRRFNHENHEKMNSFHRMIMLEMERRHLPHFQKDNNLKREDKIHKYHHHGHAVHNNSAGHAFHSIVNKAVSFLGDYTLFPVFTSLLVPLHAHSPSNELDRMLIDLCPASTEFIQSAVSSNLSDSDAAKFSCNGYGHDGSFSFHQSNQLLEKNLFQEVQSLFSSSSGTKKPDILIIQLGHQACHLPYLEESKNTEYDKSYTSKAETNIKTFFTSLKEIVDKSKSTTVIISLPSRSLLGNSDSDYCTWRLNRIIAYEAHVKGFIVLEKEEIETRLLFRTERAIDPVKTMKSLISFPGSQIIAASLIHLLNCLEQKLVFTL